MQQTLQQRSQSLIQAISEAQLSALLDLETNYENVMKDLLAKTVELLNSGFGFIGEIIYTEDGICKSRYNLPYLLDPNPKLQILAVTVAEQKYSNLLTFKHHSLLNTFFQNILEKHQVMMINDTSKQSDMKFPQGHPNLHNILALPFVKDNECIGSKFEEFTPKNLTISACCCQP